MAYVYRSADGMLYGSTDISSLSAGDIARIELDTNMVDGESYNIVLDAEGSSWTIGYDDDPSFPYTSPDGDLTISDGATGSQSSASDANAIVEIGNLQ